MDEFLRDIHTMIFKQWILIQDQSHCQISLDENKAESIIKLKDKLEDLDDVQQVYTNADI